MSKKTILRYSLEAVVSLALILLISLYLIKNHSEKKATYDPDTDINASELYKQFMSGTSVPEKSKEYYDSWWNQLTALAYVSSTYIYQDGDNFDVEKIDRILIDELIADNDKLLELMEEHQKSSDSSHNECKEHSFVIVHDESRPNISFLSIKQTPAHIELHYDMYRCEKCGREMLKKSYYILAEHSCQLWRYKDKSDDGYVYESYCDNCRQHCLKTFFVENSSEFDPEKNEYIEEPIQYDHDYDPIRHEFTDETTSGH